MECNRNALPIIPCGDPRSCATRLTAGPGSAVPQPRERIKAFLRGKTMCVCCVRRSGVDVKNNESRLIHNLIPRPEILNVVSPGPGAFYSPRRSRYALRSSTYCAVSQITCSCVLPRSPREVLALRLISHLCVYTRCASTGVLRRQNDVRVVFQVYRTTAQKPPHV